MDGDELNFIFKLFDALKIFRGKEYAFETHFDTFVYAFFGEGNAAHFAGQTDLAEHGGKFIDRLISEAAGEGGANCEVDGRLIQANAAHGIQVDVLVEEGDAASFFQNGDQKGPFRKA